MTKTASIEPTSERLGVANGSAMASFLAAGIGACAVGMFVLLNESGVFVAPALHAGAGGVSGRTTFSAAVWLIAWGALLPPVEGSHDCAAPRLPSHVDTDGNRYSGDIPAGLGPAVGTEPIT